MSGKALLQTGSRCRMQKPEKFLQRNVIYFPILFLWSGQSAPPAPLFDVCKT